jgi:hypothetical protein
LAAIWPRSSLSRHLGAPVGALKAHGGGAEYWTNEPPIGRFSSASRQKRWACAKLSTFNRNTLRCNEPEGVGVTKQERHGVRKALLVPVLAFGCLMAPFLGSASAQADPCAIANFTAADGTIDLTSYLACVAGAGAGQGGSGGGALARTGSDVGGMIGVGSGLIALGGVAVVGARRRSAALSAQG